MHFTTKSAILILVFANVALIIFQNRETYIVVLVFLTGKVTLMCEIKMKSKNWTISIDLGPKMEIYKHYSLGLQSPLYSGLFCSHTLWHRKFWDSKFLL